MADEAADDEIRWADEEIRWANEEMRRFYAKHPDEAEGLWHGDADAAARDLG
eukprot:CAMPEP_0170143438 /NCGR_PEP_ID=MMETSP0033_2-20121228/10971_1 /TAXON_ID=195969 /ORGANISM="Dolichomastix tenuilepis, Strain CCMP3274" /LENGTH=51 /DNA_ID=CAMNT_0010379885 /DNA_START=21 /DNA_END=173 /DNA_ORIENTATION=+